MVAFENGLESVRLRLAADTGITSVSGSNTEADDSEEAERS